METRDQKIDSASGWIVRGLVLVKYPKGKNSSQIDTSNPACNSSDVSVGNSLID